MCFLQIWTEEEPLIISVFSILYEMKRNTANESVSCKRRRGTLMVIVLPLREKEIP
jgi:hypothetical protein